MATRLNNPGPYQQSGITGAVNGGGPIGAGGAFGASGGGIGAGIAVGHQPPAGSGASGFINNAGALAADSMGAAAPLGADDLTTATKDGQGGGTGKGVTSECMTNDQHTASKGTGKGPATGAPTFCWICTWNGWVRVLVSR